MQKIGMDEAGQKMQTILIAVNCILGQFWFMQKQSNKIYHETDAEYLNSCSKGSGFG